ncbi:MAG: YfhO family protein, partial [Bacteroidota bacterium]
SAIAYMPLVITGILLIVKEKVLLGISVTSTAVALLIRSNHVQIAYYLFLVLLVFWIVYLFDAIKNKTIPAFGKTTAFIAVAGLLGISANLGKLWTAAEYSPYTIRGKSELTSNNQSTSGGLDRDYAFAWSNGVAESFTFMIPYFYGGASQEDVGMKSNFAEDLRKAGADRNQIRNFSKAVPTYWGDQPFTSGPIYAGIIVIFFFVIALHVIKGPLKWWLVSATILGFMLSWGKNFEAFNYLMFDYFPLYNKFRAVSMTLVIPLLCIPLLGFIGLSEFLKAPDKKILFRSVAITGGILLLLLISSAFMKFNGPNDAAMGQQVIIDAIVNQRISMFKASAFRSIVLVLLSASLIYFFIQKKVGLIMTLITIAALVFFDLYMVDKNYVDSSKFADKKRVQAYQPTDADKSIMQDNGHYRVVNLTKNVFNDATTSYHHSSIGGYHGAKLRRYSDVIEYHLAGELQGAISEIQNRSLDFSGNQAMNMLNTKYIIIGNAANAVITNSSAMGNAWFVETTKTVDSPDKAIEAVGVEDLKQVAITESGEDRSGMLVGTITLDEYRPNYLKYTSSNNEDGFAVFSEIFYPKGWKALIDGEEASIERVNYILRGLNVPAGNHTIEFSFKPSSYFVGNTVAMIGSICIILLIIGSVVIEVRNKNA